FQQGVLAGDIITNIYDEEKDEDYDPRDFETVHDAVSILRGDEGSEVTIRVLHRDSGEEEEITIERDIISVPGARSARIVDPEWKIGYVYVAQFHEKTADDLREALEELKDEGIDALVVDLRFNPGGLLKSAIDVADMFLHDSTVVSTRGRSVSEETFSTHSDDMLVDAPIAVLVNGYSASASEIVAGAIKDNDRGLIVGDTTFGKASVQSILPLGEDGGALKLTTAKYYTPSGNLIDGEGVQPHIKVDLDDADNRKLAEIIADEDDYPPILSTDDDDKDRPSFPSAYREEGELDETVSEGEEGDDEPFIDDQLLRAVDVLKATLVERSTEAKKRAESEQE
ncbi:MAG: S41 family peptidase, partial [Planctomycetota bacterium]